MGMKIKQQQQQQIEMLREYFLFVITYVHNDIVAFPAYYKEL